MKNLTIIFLSLVFTLFSCSNNEDYSTDQQTGRTETASLNYDIATRLGAFNDSLYIAKEKSSEKQPSNISGKNALKGASYLWVAAHDVYGAYKGYKLGSGIGSLFGPETSIAGGVICGLVKGSYSSYKAYKNTKFMRSALSADSLITPDLIVRAYGYGLDNGFNPHSNFPRTINLVWPKGVTPPCMGANHNMVLYNLQNSNFSTLPANTYLTEDEQKVIYSEDFQTDFNAMATSEDMDIEIDDNSNEVDDIVMSLFLQVYQDYPEKAEDVEFITNKYIELINASSEISDEDKENIYSALSVAASSYEYWEQEAETQGSDE